MNKEHNKALATIAANMTVDMNDVVNYFISKYENQLIATRQDVQHQVKDLAKQLKDLDERIIKSIKDMVDNEPLNVASNRFVEQSVVVRDVSIDWSDKKVRFEFYYSFAAINRAQGEYNTSGHETIRVYLPIEEVDVDQHQQLVDQKNELNDRLMEVNTELKGVDRKEREVRGKIAAKKLEESGFGDLLEDPDLLQLVQL